MPIGNLLAEITGEKPTPSSTATNPSLPSKRKAQDDLNGVTRKVQRTAPNTAVSSTSSPRSSGAAPRPSASTASAPKVVPTATSAPKVIPTAAPLTLANGSAGSTSLKSSGSADQRKRPGTVTAGRGSSPAPAKPVPKKGSFAEIMARAAAAQKSMGQVGKIRHKRIDKAPSKREHKDPKAELARGPRSQTRESCQLHAAGPKAQPGSTGTGYGGPHGGHIRDKAGRPSNGDVRAASTAKEAPGEAKRPKKSAVATTGYQGTARPRPLSSTTTSRSASARSPDRPRHQLPFGASRHRGRRDDYYDDEMDDFIDDDEDDPEAFEVRGRRYSYVSDDGESDMEAGLSDIDEEERRAEYVGRLEDQEQEALERKLKREKEARKRAAAAQRR